MVFRSKIEYYHCVKNKPFTDPWGLLQEIKNMVKPSMVDGKKVLDIGCGSGWIEEMLLDKGAKAIDAIDISEEVIKSAKAKKLKKVKYKVAGATNLPYPDSSFDLVVCFEVMEHIEKDGENNLFSEASRVLKKNGYFLLTTPFQDPITKALDPAFWINGHRHYSINKVNGFAESNGFKIVKIEGRGGYFTSFLLISMYASKWITKRSPLFYKFLLDKSISGYRKTGGNQTLFMIAKKK